MTTPDALQTVLLLLGCVLLAMSAARRLPVPYPVLLVLAGLLVSAVPGLPAPRLEPELVFLVFLPPVLWSAAYFTSHAARSALVRLRDEEVISDEVLVALESELDLEAVRHGLAEIRQAEALDGTD